jgi:long-subunit fatty acid transport protein
MASVIRSAAMSRAAVVIACCLCAFRAQGALASPRSDPTSGRSVFTGATVATATSIDLNPAAIGPGTTDYAYLAATAVLDQYGVRPDSLDITNGAITPGETIHDDEASPGGMVAYVWHIPGDRATLAGELRSAPAETFIANRDALAYHTLGGGQRTIRAGVGASIRIVNELYFGLSLNSDATYLHLHYARDAALENGRGPNGIDSDCGGAPCGIQNPLAQEHYDVNAATSLLSTRNLVLNVGIMVELAKDVWLGVSYHAPPGLEVRTELTGTMDVLQAPRDGANLLHGASSVFLSQPASADAELRARLPAKLDLHVGARWEDLSRLQAYDVRGFGSTFFAANIPEWQLRARGFHDPLSVWAGIEQVELDQNDDWLRFGARIGFETSSLRDQETAPLSISPFSYTADVGLQARLKHVLPKAVFQASYGVQYFRPLTVANSSFDPRTRIDCIASDYDYSTAACTSVRNGYGIPTADGRYDRLEHAIRIALIYEIGP